MKLKLPRKYRFYSTIVLLAISLIVLITNRQEDKKGQEPQPSAVGTELVVKVIDGDTVELENGQKVRYIGIDTPETTLGKNDCYGKEATEKNKELVEGKRVRLEKDISETDKFGRLLRYIYLPAANDAPEIFVNDYLVREGYASVDTVPPDIKFSEKFVLAADEARVKKRGFWDKCGETKGVSTFLDKDCSDFKTQEEALKFYVVNCGPSKDPYKLDANHDGAVCENLPPN